MAQVTFSIPREVREAVRKCRSVDWDTLVSHLLWEYATRLQLADRLARHSRLTSRDVGALDAVVKTALAKRYRVA